MKLSIHAAQQYRQDRHHIKQMLSDDNHNFC
jgi:hypothetical protein